MPGSGCSSHHPSACRRAWEAIYHRLQYAIIKILMSITLRSPGRDAHRDFDLATVKITWLHES